MATQKKTNAKTNFKRPSPTKVLKYHVAPQAHTNPDGTARARKRVSKSR